MVATMNVGCCVEGSYGKFLPAACNPDGSQASRQKRARLQGTLKMLGDPRYNSMGPVTLASNKASVASVLPSCNALAPVASPQAALLAPVPSAPFLISAPMAFNSSSSAPVASAPLAYQLQQHHLV
jgi:hypothetical protein